jgi:hypothetical protein
MAFLPLQKRVLRLHLRREAVIAMNDFYQHFESIARANPGQIDAEADLKVSAGADGAKSSNFCKINHISTVFLENSSGKTTPQRMGVSHIRRPSK